MKIYMVFCCFILMFVTSIIVWSEMSVFLSPLVYNASEEEIDFKFRKDKNMVKKEPLSYFTSMAGLDSNENGLRDDPERLLYYNYKTHAYTMSDGKTNEYFFESIKHLLKKMQRLTKYEEVSKLDLISSDFNDETRSQHELKYEYYLEYFSVAEYTACLYEKINRRKKVGSGNAFLHVIRKQLNTKKRRDFFGDHLLEQKITMFDGETFTKPQSLIDKKWDYHGLKSTLKGNTKYRPKKNKKCEIWEYK
jgi:hypothetical protein